MSHSVRIAIVHYHLRGGGVGRVIAHACAALKQRGIDTIVLTGEEPRFHVDFEWRRVARLAYDTDRDQHIDPAALVDDLQAAAGAVDLWHIHNHSLGKNAALVGAIDQLAAQGRRLVLQPHDFAEEGRPSNYAHLVSHGATGALYPRGDHVHYAFLNSRDRAALIGAGLPSTHAHALPNAVDLPATDDADVPVQRGRLFLYPTRAIRRKNVGELLLWAAACRDDESRFATTLAPTSAVDMPAYENFKQLAAGLKLPVEFEIDSMQDASFTALLRSAHALVTMSVAEGFGLAFLEPFAVGQCLRGRNLSAITDDFLRDGIDLSVLYDRLEVPLDWLDRHALRARIAQKLAVAYEAFGRSCTEDHVDAAFTAAAPAGAVDFGRLDEPLQQRIIERVAADAEAAQLMRPMTLDVPVDTERVAANRRIIAARYNLKSYGQRLVDIYHTVLEALPGDIDSIDPKRVLDQFLRPENFFLLRT